MSLDPLHEKIARTAVALPEAKQVALARGGAMLAHDLVDRPTQDVDLFALDPDEVTRLSDALAVAFAPRAPRCALTGVDLGSPDSV